MRGENETSPAEAAVDYAAEWLSDPESLLTRVRTEPEAIESDFHALDAAQSFRAASLIDLEAVTLAIADLGSRRILAVSGTMAADLARATDWELLQTVQRQGGARTVDGARGAAGSPLFVYVAGSEALGWDLPEQIAGPLRDARGTAALIIATRDTPEGPLRRVCKAFGMTGLETRVIEATLREGNIRSAAAAMRISYATARQAMSSALSKGGARRMPGLLYRLSLMAFGVLPADEAAPTIIVDRWGLKPRQAQIAVLLAQGLTRAQAARALGLSEATVKKQTDFIFQTLGVSSAAELARSISIAIVTQALVESSHGRMGWLDRNADPLRIVHSAEGRRIAISDYGNPKGRPLLIVHSSMTTRHPPRRLVSRLLDEGYHVLAIDRPGFGLTDPAPTSSDSDGDAHFAAAAHDMATVLDTLRLDRVDIVARGGAQAVMAFAARYADRCGKVVLVNPDPMSAHDKRRWGVLGFFKEAYLQRPGLILPAARLLARAITRDYLHTGLKKSMRGSPPDEAAIADARVVDDYYRAVRMFTTGRLEGYVREQLYFARGATIDAGISGAGWSVLIAGHDTLADPAAVHSYWAPLLPDAEFEILPRHGRLLAFVDPDAIVRRLSR